VAIRGLPHGTRRPDLHRADLGKHQKNLRGVSEL